MQRLGQRGALLLVPAALLLAHSEDWSKATAYKVLRTIDVDTIEVEQDGKAVRVLADAKAKGFGPCSVCNPPK